MKGDAEYVSVIISISLILLMLVFATHFLSQRNVVRDLSASIDYSESKYRRQVAGGVLMSSRIFRQRAMRYYMERKTGYSTPIKTDIAINSRSKTALEKMAESYYLDIKGVDYSNTREAEASNTAKPSESFTFTVAMPTKNQVETSVWVSNKR